MVDVIALAGRGGSGKGAAELDPDDAAATEVEGWLEAPVEAGDFLPCARLDAGHHADASRGASSPTARTVARARTEACRASVMGGLHQVFELRASAAE